MRSNIYASYDKMKKLSIYILKSRNGDVSDYFNDSAHQLTIQSDIESIENDELDENDLLKFCFSEDRNINMDKAMADVCENLGLSYYIINDTDACFYVLSSDGNFYTDYSSTALKDNDCSGIFVKYLETDMDYRNILDEIRNDIPKNGEYDAIIQTV